MNIAAENHYDVLGIGPDADDEAVKQAFRELAKSLHPDYNPGDEEAERRFKQVNVAYEALKDEARRQAYNEFLAFAERRKNFRRVQWGRLAALILVLLLGPSAVMFWLAIPRDISVVQSPAEPQAQPAKAEPTAEPQAAAGKDESGVKPKETASADRDQNPPSTTPPATAAQTPPAKPDAAPPLPKKSEPVKAESEPAKTPEEQAKAENDAKETARQNRRRFEIFLKEKAAAEGGDVTEALPKDQQQPASTPDEPAATNALPASKSQAGPDSSARRAARLLAELKEPGNGSPPPETPSAESPSPDRLASRAEGSDDAFTDCPTCPVMALTRRPVPTGRGGELAVSRSEVTVSQWSACVEDRICAPYRSVDADPGAPVVGLSERAAREYARWLTEITGHPYSVVMPLRAQARRQDAGDCVERGQRRPDGGWDWLDDQTARDCAPSSARNGEKPQGFRVARRVSQDG